ARGKALLAATDRAGALRMLPAVPHSYTPHTIISVAEIAAELDKAAEREIAYDYEEATPGICAAAIAVREPSGVLLAISVVVPALRYHDSEGAITAALREARRAALTEFSR